MLAGERRLVGALRRRGERGVHSSGTHLVRLARNMSMMVSVEDISITTVNDVLAAAGGRTDCRVVRRVGFTSACECGAGKKWYETVSYK